MRTSESMGDAGQVGSPGLNTASTIVSLAQFQGILMNLGTASGWSMDNVASWAKFAGSNADLADTGSRLLYQGNELASAYLATVAPDHGPRVHPVFPALALGELWLFIVDMSPKYRDLIRNQRFALHTLPTAQGGEEFYIRGLAELVADADEKSQILTGIDTNQGAMDFEALFRCGLKSVLYTRWDHWGTAESWPNYEKWQA